MERIKLNIQRFADDNTNAVEVELLMASEKLLASTKEVLFSLEKLKGGVTDTKKEVDNLSKSSKSLKNVFEGLDFSKAFNSIKRLGKALYGDFLSKAIDTSEELNLFNVVFDNIEKDGKTTFSALGKQAINFQNQLNEAFGTNKKETMRYQGLFQAMGESAGLKEEIAGLMSENMTKLAYDLASLYNTTETKAAESLRAGVYAG